MGGDKGGNECVRREEQESFKCSATTCAGTHPDLQLPQVYMLPVHMEETRTQPQRENVSTGEVRTNAWEEEGGERKSVAGDDAGRCART